jgi:ABC-type Fe3+-hydroxamate transport system substrate-binding protein
VPEMDKIYLSHPPRRVISLVPSVTESLFDLGFGQTVVGVTDYCTHPADALTGVPRIGGPKNAHVEEIIALKPDLVFANQEENSPEIVRTLQAAGIPVWIFFPKTVKQVITDLWDLSGIYQSEEGGLRVHTIELALDWITALSQDLQPIPYFCPIWQEDTVDSRWWMTFNSNTYMDDLLRLFGGRNIFADRTRRYPLLADLDGAEEEDAAGRDVRYPRVTFEEILNGCPEVILLPDEPFIFEEQHRHRFLEWFHETPAVKNGHVYLIDGSLLMWPGTRLARALSELSGVFEI